MDTASKKICLASDKKTYFSNKRTLPGEQTSNLRRANIKYTWWANII